MLRFRGYRDGCYMSSAPSVTVMQRANSRSRSAAQVPAAIDPARDRRRSDAELIVEILRRVHVDDNVASTLQPIAQTLLGLFGCRRILVAAREHEGGRAMLWTAQSAHGDAAPRVRRVSLLRSTREALFSPAPACWHALRRGRSTGVEQFEIMYPGRPDDATRPTWSRCVPRALDVLRPQRTCMAVAFEFGAEWTCRLFVVDPTVKRPRRHVLRLAQDVVAALSPALYNVYVAERLRTSAAETERANLARTLHDGVIQSLIAAEMEVHMACRRSTDGSTVAITELRRIQHMLHNEVLGLRDLMQRIKPVQIAPEELCDALSDCVAKFKADTGIVCAFSAEVAQVSLPPALCPPVVRIVQEALSNVRKHSGARHVMVHVQETSGRWRLVIEDDGRGLDPNVPVPAPLVIRECVRSLDGDLQVLRAPGGGLRLEIAFAGYVPSAEAVATRPRLVAVRTQASVSVDRSRIPLHGSRDRRVARRSAEAVPESGRGAPRPVTRSAGTRRAPVLGLFKVTAGVVTRSQRQGRRTRNGKDA
jgi:signal transduction histidine kinase